MKKLISFIITLLIILSPTIFSAFANDVVYAEEDIQALMKIYNYSDNSEYLEWDFDNPESIYEVIWEEMEDEKFHIVSITLSNLDISGTVDLKDCVFLDSVSFSNSNVVNVILPSNLETLNSSAFSNCSSLIFVELNSEEITIERNAFSGCINFRTLLNTDSITTIGPNAFNKCSKVKFYGDTKTSYAYGYARDNRINFSMNKTVTAHCYVGIMMNKQTDIVDLTNGGIPYHTGYIDNAYGTFFADSDGRIDIDIDLGSRQSVTIDGATAASRDALFLIPYDNYEINSESNAIGIIVCDYVNDEYINAKDFAFLHKYQVASSAENYCYDIDGDGVITSSDENYVIEFLSTNSNWKNQLYTSWK